MNNDKVPDNNDGAYARGFEAICQVLKEVLFDPAETYTLTVKVGRAPGSEAEGSGAIPPTTGGSPEWHGYFVQLLAGGVEVNPRRRRIPTMWPPGPALRCRVETH